jgi:energy-coupling factor transporter ATP-binding protein EcfA2
MKKQNSFPWGVYIGDFINDNDGNIPLCLDSKDGGFCIIYDEESEDISSSFVENVVLKLLDVTNFGDTIVDIFDFSIKKRFHHLATLKNNGIYTIAISQNEARDNFDGLEKIAIHRHHNILNTQVTDISSYNQNSKFIEKYHLILINLEHFPDDFTSYSRLKEFVDSAYQAGFYIIGYGSEEILQKESKSVAYILNNFKKIVIKDKKIIISKDICSYLDALDGYSFEQPNGDRGKAIKELLGKLATCEGDEKEFLSIVIGTSLDGREDIYFRLGDKSKNYHAFITGISGSGKSTLINSIITGIAKNYTSDEIRLYLMDYKDGVEFGLFENHPNCEKIYLDNQNLQAALELLESFVSLKEQRSELFRLQKVSGIDSYNAKNPNKPMPRNILIIDEVHRLFSNQFQYSEQKVFNGLLEEVAKQGRSFGLHIILTTQSLEGVNIEQSILNQIPLRISYKLQTTMEAMKIFDQDNTDEVRNLSKYEFIYNNNGGIKSANIHARASYLSKETIIETIEKVVTTREASLVIKPIIIDKDYTIPLQHLKQPDVKDEPREQPSDISPYDTSSEKELLAMLKAQGGIHE